MIFPATALAAARCSALVITTPSGPTLLYSSASMRSMAAMSVCTMASAQVCSSWEKSVSSLAAGAAGCGAGLSSLQASALLSMPHTGHFSDGDGAGVAAGAGMSLGVAAGVGSCADRRVTASHARHSGKRRAEIFMGGIRSLPRPADRR